MKHTITHADELFWGNPAKLGARAERGVPINPLVKFSLGAPLTLDANGLIVAATGAELPNAETINYAFPSAGTSPLDGANQTGTLDVPRNITIAVTHASSVVAMTVVVTGKDKYGDALVESIAIAATGTTQAGTGKKAFKSVSNIALTAAGDSTTNTLDLGWGDVLGLPYRLEGKYDLLSFSADETAETITSTVVAAVATSPATATTGDVRGTIDPATACNGTVVFRGWMKIQGVATVAEAYGVAQYGG